MDFTLRKWHLSDIDNLTKYANNKKIADNLRDSFPYPYTTADAEFFIKSCIDLNQDSQYTRVIDIDGKSVGSIGVFFKDDVYCKSAEIGYWLAEPFWSSGIVTSAIKKMCTYTFKHYDIVRIFAEPFAQNAGSRRALEKAGFKLEGILEKSVYKNGHIYDSCMYALIKHPRKIKKPLNAI